MVRGNMLNDAGCWLSTGAFLLITVLFGNLRCSADEAAMWQSVIPHVDLQQHVVAGMWRKENSELKVNAAAGARIVLPVKAVSEFDFEVTFTRHSGEHSVALIVPHGDGQFTFEVDAWGQHLSGIQRIAGRDLRDNPTRSIRSLTNGKRHTMTVEVRRTSVRCLFDGQAIAEHQTNGNDLSMVDLWRLPSTRAPGIGVWDSDATIHEVRVRSVSENTPMLAGRDTQKSPTENTVPPSSASSTGQRNSAMRRDTAPARRSETTGSAKHVLIVIANQDFFYREYADPREELERAGIRVTVAAGERRASRPHQNSGEGPDGGVVMPDLALSNVRMADYDAVLFSGGWGSSMYQYAFSGRYDNPVYNGNAAAKREANRIVNESLAAGKFTCALCNAVSVLAWARVDGQSPLRGKLVCAPTREAPAGLYNGRRMQPSCRWHPEQNGARLSPPGAIGRSGTAEDDVAVDGLIVTGEDDISARQMGRTLVALLTARTSEP